MGVSQSRPEHQRALKADVHVFAKWDVLNVRSLLQSFRRMGQYSGYGFAMVRSQFEAWLCTATDQRIDSAHAARIFRIFDDDVSGCVDILEFLGGVVMFSRGSFLEKMRLCFELYDFNINGHLSALELTLLMRQTYSGAMKMMGDYTPIMDADVEDLSRHAFNVYDDDRNTAIDVAEFAKWATGNRRASILIDVVDVAADRARGCDDENDSAAEECADEEISDLESEDGYRRRKAAAASLRSKHPVETKSAGAHEPRLWGGAAARSRNRQTIPDASLELEWVHGYKSSGLGSRNNIFFVRDKYTDKENLIVYPAASVAVVLDTRTHTQRLYTGHDDEVTAIALHPGRQIVASGQRGGYIHLWDASVNETEMKCVLSSFHTEGVCLLSFSKDGHFLASVGADADHTMAIWHWVSGIVVASTKLGPSPIYDIAWGPKPLAPSKQAPDSCLFLAVCGSKFAKEFAMRPRGGVFDPLPVAPQQPAAYELVGSKLMISSSGKLQTFVSIAYMKSDIVIGTANGELYHFQSKRLVKVVKAHMERQHVSCLCEWSEGGIISGSKDGTVRRWDLALKEIGKPIDVGSLSSSPAGSHSVICVRADSAGNKLVVGTRSSDIIQLTFKGTASSDLRPKEKTLVTGHCVSAALCVATHPTMGEFATCGADCTLRVWNAKTKKCVSERLPSTGSAVSYSADGNHLAVGLNNGELIVMQTTAGYRKVTTLILTDAETQAKKNNYKSEAPRNAISALAYSPDGKSLAVGCAAGYVFIYNIHEGVYVCGSVCDSDGSSVKTIDWSVDSKALQSVDGMGRLIRWDSSGNRVDSASSVKDVLWNTWTCTDGWPVQGARGASSTIISCARSNDHGEDLLAVGSSAGAIELYKYPCTQSGADVPAKRIYYGHVGNITAIRFLPGGTNLVSISDVTVA